MKITTIYLEKEPLSLEKNHEEFFARLGLTLSSLLIKRLSFNSPNFNHIGTAIMNMIEIIILVLNSNYFLFFTIAANVLV
ncbi:hypothetical protein [Cellulophaga sp. E6(2014)]|uniref:hypothetical protein n=1 Tax=Cellulophaga sp. E6(2014) TaxID=1495334 RepID=UPI00051D52B6|nr:hypothetical protein [Cellulophaga sp. E6(2014)]KGK29467.1 hypothetical protein EL45_15295 [Cellulophaga sp. E6(2014)]